MQNPKVNEVKVNFYNYCPIKSYSDSQNNVFIQKNGKELFLYKSNSNYDLDELFNLGREAFRRIEKSKGNLDFTEVLYAYDSDINELRSIAKYLFDSKRLKLLAGKSKEQLKNPDWEDMADSQIINICWEVLTTIDSSDFDSQDAFYQNLLVCTLIEIDNTISDLIMGDSGVGNAICAANLLSNSMAIESNNKNFELSRKSFALSGAVGRLKTDPRQKEKSFVFDCWKKWKLDTSIYTSKASFARDMLDKCEHLTSQKKIEDWCREWERKID